MAFYAMHRSGAEDDTLKVGDLDRLLSELDDEADDSEHTEVSVIGESDWSITVARDGKVTLEHVEDVEAGSRHLAVDRETALRLMTSLAVGDLDTVFVAGWSQPEPS